MPSVRPRDICNYICGSFISRPRVLRLGPSSGPVFRRFFFRISACCFILLPCFSVVFYVVLVAQWLGHQTLVWAVLYVVVMCLGWTFSWIDLYGFLAIHAILSLSPPFPRRYCLVPVIPLSLRCLRSLFPPFAFFPLLLLRSRSYYCFVAWRTVFLLLFLVRRYRRFISALIASFSFSSRFPKLRLRFLHHLAGASSSLSFSSSVAFGADVPCISFV
jgi:hypothetical protein